MLLTCKRNCPFRACQKKFNDPFLHHPVYTNLQKQTAGSRNNFIINQIDIRTTKFLETYLMSENHICQLFSNRTQCALTDIFLSYDSNINSSVNLRNVILNSFLGDLSE